MFSDKLNWDEHIKNGRGSLLANLKQRLNSLKLISKKISKKFAKQIANGIIMSKINYNIETWGNTSNENRRKIDKIIVDAAKIIIEKKTFGRTEEWILNEVKWLNVKKNYENTTQNNIYRIINSNEEHFFDYYLTSNRNVRNRSQNKLGHHHESMGRSKYTQQTFLYKSIEVYNKLPKELTLIKEQRIFKKWIKRYNIDNSIKLKQQENYIDVKNIQEINYETIDRCQSEY